MNVMRRETVEIVRPECEANLRPRYLLEGASWIWHPARGGREQAVLKFRNRFRLDKPTQALIQVSGTRQRGPDGGAGRLVFHFLVGGKPVPLRHGQRPAADPAGAPRRILAPEAARRYRRGLGSRVTTQDGTLLCFRGD